MISDKRPLSPHLQVYRLPMIVVMSITHRATGVALVAGALVLVYWLVAAANGADAYAEAQRVLGSLLGKIFLFLWTWALFYHAANGVRHLAWDLGYGFELKTADASGITVIAASVILTIVTWLVAF
ncbi:MAG TPA: succinate dehydrogenase, cytochrome b556 subunit [Burkholderiales bacterium]|nr:succinate dehydrogenase, cytochrome b556 subunit [Burkholderiales bacterium]